MIHKTLALQREKSVLFPKAATSGGHVRFSPEDEDHRLPYKRDVDRLINSKAYARYVDKTQVVYLVPNDHLTHRSLHVQLVSNFARSMADQLGLNTDLVEAIALGHDVGHAPFGHEGENYLSDLSVEHGNGLFLHNIQSCRLLFDIEPLNLGLGVYDGFLCHSGGLVSRKLKPDYNKTFTTHFDQLAQRKENPGLNMWPMTLEGCLVKLCDKISYIGRDLEDALRLKLISKNEIPKTCLGFSNKEILHAVAVDLLNESFEKEEIIISEEVFESLKILRAFNFERIYVHPKLKVESGKIKRSYRYLFETLLEDYLTKKENSLIFKEFLHNKNEAYLIKTKPVQAVVDYIAGMTDTFFVRSVEQSIIPQRINI